jgi:membrane protease YdiL (CAAX protease family)
MKAMENANAPETNANWLLSVSLRRPVLVMFVLFVLAILIKVLDTLVLRLDELLGEAILTKSLGFVLILAYVWICGRKLRDIGFKSRFVGKALLLAFVCFISLYIVAFAAQIIALRIGGEDAGLGFSAVDYRTGMSGGLLFGAWLLLGNLVNSAMEEGLFRGVMLRHFMRRYSPWRAILLAAGLFALWHMTGPIKILIDVEASSGQAAFEAVSLLIATSIAGIVYGYLYLKTDNLWAPFLAHTINNTIFNLLFIRTGAGMRSGLEFGLFQGIFLIGYLCLIPLIRYVSRRWDMPEVKPWGAFDEIGTQAP